MIGLIEQEWIETLSTLDFDDVIYESFIEAGTRLAKELRENNVSERNDFILINHFRLTKAYLLLILKNVDYVIALTHMRVN